MKTFLKWIALAAAVGVLTTAAALLAVGPLVETGPVQRRLQSRIDAAIPGRIAWEDLDLSLAAGRLAVSGLTIAQPDGQPVVLAGRVEVEVDWARLLHGEVRIPRIRVSAPTVRLSTSREGNLNLTAVFVDPEAVSAQEPETGPPAWPARVRIDTLGIEAPDLEFRNGSARWRVTGETVHLDGEALLTGPEGLLNLGLKRIRVEGPQLFLHLAQGDVGLALTGDRLDVIRCTLVSDASRLSLGGRVEGLGGAPAAELDLAVDLDLPEIDRVLRLGGLLDGRMHGHAAVHGALNHPEASARLEMEGGRLGDLRIDKALLEASLDKDRVRVHRLSAEAGEGRVDLTADAGLAGMFPNGLLEAPVLPDALTYTVDLKVADLSLRDAWTGPTPVTGTVFGQIALAGEGVDPERVRGRLTVDAGAGDLAVGDAAPIVSAKIRAQASVAPDRLEVLRLEATADTLSLTGEGRLERPEFEIDARADLEAPNLGAVLSALGLEGAEGSARLHVAAEGALPRPRLDLAVDSRRLGFDAYALGDLQLKAQLAEDGMLRVPEFALTHRKSRLSGQAELQLLGADGGIDPDGRLTAALRLDGVNPADFDRGSPVAGRMSGTLDLSGTLRHPEARATLKARGLSAAATPIGDLAAELRFSEGRLFADRLDLSRGRSRISASGAALLLDPDRFAPVADPAVDLSISPSRIHLEDLTERASGTATVAAALSGTLSRPIGTASVEGRGLRIDRQPVSRVLLKADIAGERLTLDPIRIELDPGQTVSGRGWLDRSGGYQIAIGTEGLALESLQAVAETQRLSGRLAAAFSGAGTFEAPHLSGTVRLENLRFDGRPMDDAAFQIALDPRRITLDGDPGFAVSGELDWHTLDFSAALGFSETPLAPYFALAGRPDLSGRLTGSLTARGNGKRPAEAEGRLDVAAVEVRYQDATVLSATDLRARMTGGRIEIPAATLRLADRGRLTLAGSGRLDGEVQASVSGDIPLDVAGRFTDALPDLTGTLGVSVELSGPVQNPGFVADLKLQGAGFTIPDLLQRVQGVDGAIHATAEAVTVTGLQGRLETGTFGLNGTMALEDFAPAAFDLTFVARELPVSVPDTLDLRLNADLFLTGPQEAPRLAGNLVLVDGLYYRDFKVRLVEAVDQLRRPAPAQAPPGLPPMVARTRLEVAVSARNPFLVDNNVALLTVEPDLRIAGTVGNPVVNGRAEVTSGVIRYNRREFTLTRGVVDFVNPYRIEPLLDLSAESEIREWTIALDVTGTPDNLRFRLSSSPPENNADILSLLAFGKTSSELLAGEASSGSAMPKELLATLVADELAGRLKETAGIDRLDVEVEAAESPEEEDVIKVTVGKELSRRLSVLYDVETRKGEAVQQVTTEFKLLERLVLSAFQNNAGDFGGELQFRIEFR